MRPHNMKTALVRPNYASHIITPPLGIGYLSAYLRQNGVPAILIDGLRDGLDNDQIVARLLREDVKVAGVTCLTSFYNEVVDLSNKLVAAGIKVIVGGVHPTFLPYRTLVDSRADFVICGEAEIALLELLRSDFANYREIPGVYSLENCPGENEHTVKAQPVTDLDSLPFPDWESMPPSSYPRAPHGAIARRFPIGVVVSSRGCPYACTFCASPGFHDRRIRFRSPENVIDEIEYLVKRHGVKEIHFEDDNLTLKRKHVEEICHLILERNLSISWACPNGIRADKIDEDLVCLMKRSGCYSFAFGVESANPGILRTIRKDETIETIRNAITLAERIGIACQGFFIFGLPGETPETIEETIDFALSSGLSRAQFLILDVLPGSDLSCSLSGHFTPNWSKLSYKEPEWLPKGLDKGTLMAAQSRAFRKFYFRPVIAYRMLRHLRFGQILFLFSRLREYRIL